MNKLLTVDEMVAEVQRAINLAADEGEKNGVPRQETIKAIVDGWQTMAGFPEEQK